VPGKSHSSHQHSPASAPPLDIETFEPIIPPERAIKEWVPDD
jgi:hypothetical protein